MFLLRMLMRKGRGGSMDPLHVSMTGVRMGERFLLIGCPRQGAARGAGVQGRLERNIGGGGARCGDTKRAQAIGAKVGALIEIYDIDQGRAWPIEDDQFDMIVVDDRLALSRTWTKHQADLPEQRASRREARRTNRSGRAAEISAPARRHPLNELNAAGFKPVRVLAERGGFRFLEGLRGNNG